MAPLRAPGGRNRSRPDHDDEGVVVRQYRYLLSTATVDALEGIHAEVLEGMTETERRQVLRCLSEAFATGGHLGTGEVDKISHLVADGAHRHARAWIDSLDIAFARQLAQAALDAEGSFGRLNGYAYWDGTSPGPAEDAGPNDGFNPRANRYHVDADPRFNQPGGIGGGG